MDHIASSHRSYPGRELKSNMFVIFLKGEGGHDGELAECKKK